MSYKVIESFTDLQDRNYVYITGETYPRNGYTPSDERVAELSGESNKLGYPLIEKVDGPVEDTVLEVPVTTIHEEAQEEAKEAASGVGTGENSPKPTEAKRTPKEARGKASKIK